MPHIATHLPTSHQKVQRRHPLRRAQPRLPRKVMQVRNQPLHEVIDTRIPALRTDSHHIGRNIICCEVQQGPWLRRLCHVVRCPRQIVRAVRLQESRTPSSYIFGPGGRWHDCPVVDSPFGRTPSSTLPFPVCHLTNIIQLSPPFWCHFGGVGCIYTLEMAHLQIFLQIRELSSAPMSRNSLSGIEYHPQGTWLTSALKKVNGIETRYIIMLPTPKPCTLCGRSTSLYYLPSSEFHQSGKCSIFSVVLDIHARPSSKHTM